jgi:hypothetical protein
MWRETAGFWVYGTLSLWEKPGNIYAMFHSVDTSCGSLPDELDVGTSLAEAGLTIEALLQCIRDAVGTLEAHEADPHQAAAVDGVGGAEVLLRPA